jgi:hypothetical protein
MKSTIGEHPRVQPGSIETNGGLHISFVNGDTFVMLEQEASQKVALLFLVLGLTAMLMDFLYRPNNVGKQILVSFFGGHLAQRQLMLVGQDKTPVRWEGVVLSWVFEKESGSMCVKDCEADDLNYALNFTSRFT